jgi:hypothetical protein
MVYHVKAESISLAKRIARAAFVVLLTCALNYLWLWRGANKSGSWDWFDLTVIGVVTFLLDSRRREFDLEVDDETIRMRGGVFGVGNSRVRRGHIRYFHESSGNMFREPALWLSEHGRGHRFFFGRVSIPANLPEYAQIRATAMTWMEIG